MNNNNNIPPMGSKMLKMLFEHLKYLKCDNTLKQSKNFLKANNLDVAANVEWLENNGGYCDCEVLMNVMCREE